MQVELSGNHLFIYSGRDPERRNPTTNKIIYELNDPFSRVQIIRVDKISSVEIDYSEEYFKLNIEGFQYPILCTFGNRNCYRINSFYEAIDVIKEALKYDHDKGCNMNRRSKNTSLCVQPADVMREEEGYNSS